MPLINCQHCGTPVKVTSFLAATEQPCSKCGALLMGTLEPSSRTNRPADFNKPLPDVFARTPPKRSHVALGILLGALAGLGFVLLLATFGSAIPLHVHGAILGALTGVLLAPVIAIVLFIYMLVPVLNLTLLGFLGDDVWSGIADALCQRKLQPLVFPFLIFVVLPMGLCGVGGSKTKAITTVSHVTAAVGAMALGMVVGGIAGNVPRRREL